MIRYNRILPFKCAVNIKEHCKFTQRKDNTLAGSLRYADRIFTQHRTRRSPTYSIQGKVRPETGHEDPEGEYRYSSTLSLISALHEGERSTSRPGRFTPWKKTRYPLYRRPGGHQKLTGRVRKSRLQRDLSPGPSSS